jgi:hypothetical protein
MGAVGGTPPTGSSVPNIFIDLGQGSYTQFASSNVPTNANIGAVYSASFIGALEFKSFTTTNGSLGYYYAGTNTNPPFFLDTRPQNNAVQIFMATNGATQSIGFTPVAGTYTLTLQLEKLD